MMIRGGAATNQEPSGKSFWSFQPLHHSPPPRLRGFSWGVGPIDAFVGKALEEHQLQPAPAAPRRVLARRLFLDLTGLPPTPEELSRFLDDAAPDAWARCVDRLLASPRYGERWCRHWLDVARFGESHGFEHDTDRPNAFHYRDFVIQALNQDLPFDRFARWQIAGDELAPENILAWEATGFLAAGTHATQITANQAEKERYDELDDMAATTGAAMLGLSVGCARCHDHKFDPIATEDYYRLIATFTKTVRSDHEVPTDPAAHQRAMEEFRRDHAVFEQKLRAYEKDVLPSRLEAWERTGEAPAAPEWLTLDGADARSKDGATFARQADGSFIAQGKNGDFDVYTFRVRSPVGRITAVRLDAMADPSMPHRGPGRAGNGNFDLTDFALAWETPGAAQPQPLKFTSAAATFEQSGLPVAAAIDDNPKSGWAVDPRFGTNHSAMFRLAAAFTNSPDTTLIFTLKFNGNNQHNIGRPRLSVTAAESPSLKGEQGSMTVAEASEALRTPRERRSTEAQARLLAWFRTQDEGWKRLDGERAKHAAREPKPDMRRVLVCSEGLPAVRLNTQGPDFYEKTFLLKRGDLAQKQSEAAPGFLPVLMRDGGRGEGWTPRPQSESRTPRHRTALAEWMTDVDHGAGALLARVIVNRLWQHHFAMGIVATPSDFGKQGARPTHPELLDYLALRLIDSGWSLKAAHREILRSATYQQASMGDADSARKDPANLWLSRYPRQRLDAEAIRDSMLAVSGRLDRRMFGPGSLEETMTRRSVYFTMKRSRLIPMLTQFDGPDCLQSLGRRVNTTVAPQALFLMNNSQVRASATVFARLATGSGSRPAAASVRDAFERALARPPSSEELSDVLTFLERQSALYGGADGRERAMTDFCQALFGMNDFLYVD
ncbi:MAG: DUF1549 domain-containing protein [Verrucomicrobia bacterium]|nr:DUF1549 domain-containing protein [Verrucomicrobiota bacterium]